MRLRLKSIVLAMATACAALACGDAVDDGPDETPERTPDPIPNAAPAPVPTSLVCPKGTLLTYENFGAAFMHNHCTSCHSAVVSDADRAGAPAAANFDTADDISLWRARILAVTKGDSATMPPSQSVPSHELEQLAQWLNCGAPEN